MPRATSRICSRDSTEHGPAHHHPVVAADLHAADVDDGGLAVQFAAHQLERLRDGNQRVHARSDLQRFQFAAPPAAADRADHGALGAADDVGLEAAFLDSFDHVFDLLLGGVRTHIDDHGCLSPGFLGRRQQKSQHHPSGSRPGRSLLRFCGLICLSSHPQSRLYLPAPPIPREAARKGESIIERCAHRTGDKNTYRRENVKHEPWVSFGAEHGRRRSSLIGCTRDSSLRSG